MKYLRSIILILILLADFDGVQPVMAQNETIWEKINSYSTLSSHTSNKITPLPAPSDAHALNTTNTHVNIQPTPVSIQPNTHVTIWEQLNRRPSAAAAVPEKPQTIWEKLNFQSYHAPGYVSPIPIPESSPSKAPFSSVTSFFTRVGDGMHKIGRALDTKIKVQGQQTIGFHMENVTGSTAAYQTDNYFGQQGLAGSYDNTDLTVEGKVLGLINFQTHYSNNIYGNPYNNQISLNYASKNLKVDAGDITGTIRGNSLINFTRSLQGVQVSANVTKGLKLTSLYTQTRAQVQTITIHGGNGPGPYYVYAGGQIVDGSVQVRVNNQPMVQGTDYTLDTTTGELTFKTGMIISEMDTIAVSFETYGLNQSVGTINGWRADVTSFRGAQVGLTYMQETTPNGSSSLQTKTDQFYGYNNAGTPYVLTYPVDLIVQYNAAGQIVSAAPKYPMQAYIGATLKTYGVDYIVDPSIPNQVYFAYPVPSSEIIKITYTPQVVNDVPGNRNVWGMDSTFSLGKLGNVSAEMASSSLQMTSGLVSGTAWNVRSNMSFLNQKLDFTTYLRNIGSDYTSIESTGFQQNERGVTLGMDYQITHSLKLSTTYESTKKPDYSYDTTGTSTTANSTGLDNFKQIQASLNWQIGRAGQFSFSHNGMDTILAAGGESNYTTDNLGLNWNFKSFGFGLNMGENKNYSSYVTTASTTTGSTTTPTQLSVTGTNSFNTNLNMHWRAGSNLNLSGVLADSSMTSNTGVKSSATDMSLTADTKPMRNVSLKLSYQNQNSGNYSLYGTTTSTPTTTTSLATNAIASKMMYAFPGFPFLRYGTPAVRDASSIYNNFPNIPTANTGTSLLGSITDTTYAGGGYNSAVGGYGNYSGLLSNSSANTYNSTSFTGQSNGISALLSYQPWRTMSFDLDWSQSSSQGNYLYNSTQNSVTLNWSYNTGERFACNASISAQNMIYLGNNGGSNSSLFFFNIRTKPWGKLTTTLSYQSMVANSTLSSSATNTTTSIPGSITIPSTMNTQLNAYSSRFEYPVWLKSNAYLEYDDALSTGYLASEQKTFLLGIDFGLTQNASFSLGWRYQENISTDVTTGSNNYQVNSLDANINLHF